MDKRIMLVLLFVVLAKAQGRVYIWEVKQEWIGSYKEEILTINGQSPGPTIYAHERQSVSVTVTNRLKEYVSFHWYNTHQMKSPGSKGIPPGKNFTYLFIAERLGKSPYESYYTRQTQTGLRGLIDVLPLYSMAESLAHDYDQSIILSDQYYISNYDWAAQRESLLIPKKGKFDCAKSTTPSSHPTACNVINPEYSHWRVIFGKTYCVNISSVTAQSTLSFQIESHNLTIVVADRHYVEPSLIVFSGETCFVKIKADQDPSRNYQITTTIVGQNATTTTSLGLAVLSYYPLSGPIRNGVAPQLVHGVANEACAGYRYRMALAFLLMQMWLIKIWTEG